MIRRVLTASRDAEVDSSSVALASCEEIISTIAEDVAGLQGELELLRAEAGRFVERQAAQEALVARGQPGITHPEAERSPSLTAAEELDDAETRLSESESRAESLAQELRTLREALVDRDRKAADVEGELARMREALSDRESALRQSRTRLEELEARSERDGRAAPDLAGVARASDDGPHGGLTGHVRFVAYSDGYRLLSSDERCAGAGDVVELEGRSFLVTRVGRSPLPGDVRPCAYLTTDTSAA